MLHLSKRDIRQGYKGIKNMALKEIENGDYEKAMEYVTHCATLAQQFNWIYADLELETGLKEIGEKIILDVSDEYISNENNVVLYDDFHTTVILAAQYIGALIEAGKNVLYINTTLPDNSDKQNKLVDYISIHYPTVKVLTIPKISKIERIQYIFKSILEYKPAKLILHLYAHSDIIPLLFRLPKQITKYIINLADQTFWLGASAVDYVLEFRQFGVSVSQQRRSIKAGQQLLIPFYPIVDDNPFQGFPKECYDPNKIIIFSGGDIYKVLDRKKTYWHLVKRILDTYPQVVFIFATKADNIGLDLINSFISNNHYEGRFIYTKFRSDINEVFKHIDIYMGTCPASGSLMSQLAARNSIPILQYYYPGTPDDETEQAICYNEDFPISFNTEIGFMEEAEKLINDASYRKSQGKRLANGMITIEQFSAIVKESLCSNRTAIELKPYLINYQELDKRWYELEKLGYLNTMSYVYGVLGRKNCFRWATSIFIKRQLNRFITF